MYILEVTAARHEDKVLLGSLLSPLHAHSPRPRLFIFQASTNAAQPCACHCGRNALCSCTLALFLPSSLIALTPRSHPSRVLLAWYSFPITLSSQIQHPEQERCWRHQAKRKNHSQNRLYMKYQRSPTWGQGCYSVG